MVAMYRNFHVENFRGFGDFAIDDFARVNIITGKNDVGKTCLLEAIFLHVGRHNPQLPGSIEFFRGRENVEVNAEAIWGWVFKDRQVSRPIVLQATDEDGHQRELVISLTGRASSHVPAVGEPNTGETTGAILPDLRLEYDTPEGERLSATLRLRQDGQPQIQWEGPQAQNTGVFVPSSMRFPADDAVRYSKVDAAGGIPELVGLAQCVDPRVRRLSLGYEAGRPILRCDVGLERLIPLHVAGAGLQRFVSIALAIKATPGGFVLIDEIENGLHHAALSDVWRGIEQLTEREHVQVFATTHSWECIRAAWEAFGSGLYGKEGLMVYRLDRTNGEVKAAEYDYDSLDNRIRCEAEIRG